MKKEVIVLLLLGLLLASPLVSAQEQAQTYSGFNRFVDNVKLFFSSGDKKVMLALNIREKEVNSAIENNKKGNSRNVDKNLENAWKKLQIVQEKVSVSIASDVKKSSEEIKDKISNEENLLDNFELYILEEEKIGLKAEQIIEVEGKEGQTLERKVKTVVEENEKQNRVVEIERRIDEIDNEISNWVVENDDVEGENRNLVRVVKNEIAKVDDVIDIPAMHKDNDDVLPAPNIVDNDMCKKGDENCNNDDMAPGPQGIVGYQEIKPREDRAPSDFIDNSNSESSDTAEVSSEVSSSEVSSSEASSSEGDNGITGAVVGSGNRESFLRKILKKIFGI